MELKRIMYDSGFMVAPSVWEGGSLEQLVTASDDMRCRCVLSIQLFVHSAT